MCYASITDFKTEYPDFKEYDDQLLLISAILFIMGEHTKINVDRVAEHGLKMLATIHWSYRVNQFLDMIKDRLDLKPQHA